MSQTSGVAVMEEICAALHIDNDSYSNDEDQQ
jgi:hypothetical protein